MIAILSTFFVDKTLALPLGMEGKGDGRRQLGIVFYLARGWPRSVPLGFRIQSGDSLQNPGKQKDEQADEPQGTEHDGHAGERDTSTLSIDYILKAEL